MEKKFCKKHIDIELSPIGLGSNRRVKCRKCNVERVTQRRRNVKALLVKDFGGKCIMCGYNKSVQALQFHHIDPSMKDFAISTEGVTRSYAKAKAEANKCILICSNCHSEVHAGITEIPVVNSEVA